MKTGWERHIPIIALDKQEIQDLVALYNPELEVERAELLSGGLIHSNYKVSFVSGDKPLVVRISEDHDNMLKEFNIHGCLSKNDKVPRFYWLDQVAGRTVGVMEWMEGVPLKDKLLDYSPPEAYQAGFSIGDQLSEFKKVSFQTSGFLDAHLNMTESFELTPEGFLNTIKYFIFESKVTRWLDEDLVDKVMPFSSVHAPLFELDRTGPRLVHGDFNGLNLLMDGAHLSAILDWEFGIAGSLYMDIGNLLRYQDIPNYQEFETGFETGLLEKGEALPKEWRRIAKLADLVSLLSMLDNDLGGHNRVRDINRLIHKTLDNFL